GVPSHADGVRSRSPPGGVRPAAGERRSGAGAGQSPVLGTVSGKAPGYDQGPGRDLYKIVRRGVRQGLRGAVPDAESRAPHAGFRRVGSIATTIVIGWIRTGQGPET